MLDQILKSEDAVAACKAQNYTLAAEIINASTKPTVSTKRLLLEEVLSLFSGSVGDTGLKESDFILTALQSSPVPRVKSAYTLLSGRGLPMGDPQVQEMVDVLSEAYEWPAGLADRVKALGVVPAPVYTAEQVKGIWEYHQQSQSILRLAARRSAIVTALERLAANTKDTEELPTLEAVVAELTANWPEV